MECSFTINYISVNAIYTIEKMIQKSCITTTTLRFFIFIGGRIFNKIPEVRTESPKKNDIDFHPTFHNNAEPIPKNCINNNYTQLICQSNDVKIFLNFYKDIVYL